MEYVKKIEAAMLAALLVITVGIGSLAQLNYAQAQEQEQKRVQISAEETEDKIVVVITFLKDQIKNVVNETIKDLPPDQEVLLQTTIANVSADVANDTTASHEIKDVLLQVTGNNGTEQVPSEFNITQIQNLTVGDVAEAATEEVVVNEIVQDNQEVVNEAAQVISDAVVDSVVDPGADVQEVVNDAIDEATGIIQDGITEEEVTAVLEDLDSGDVVDAIQNDEVNIQDDIIEVIATTTTEEGPVDETHAGGSNAGGVPAAIDALQEQVSNVTSRVDTLEQRVDAVENAVEEGSGANVTEPAPVPEPTPEPEPVIPPSNTTTTDNSTNTNTTGTTGEDNQTAGGW